jgi:AcrR family transcriptional regulator
MNTKLKKQERLSGEERQSQIIDVALNFFAEKGYNGTRTRDIARAAGISETLIFQYFKTKKGLYQASLQRLFGGHPAMPDIEKKMVQKDDFGVLKNLAVHLISHSKEDRRIIRLAIFAALEGFSMGEESHHGENATPSMPALLESYIKLRIQDGAFKAINPRVVSKLFIEFIYAYILDQETGISSAPLTESEEEVVDTIVRIFMDGIRS